MGTGVELTRLTHMSNQLVDTQLKLANARRELEQLKVKNKKLQDELQNEVASHASTYSAYSLATNDVSRLKSESMSLRSEVEMKNQIIDSFRHSAQCWLHFLALKARSASSHEWLIREVEASVERENNKKEYGNG